MLRYFGNLVVVFEGTTLVSTCELEDELGYVDATLEWDEKYPGWQDDPDLVRNDDYWY